MQGRDTHDKNAIRDKFIKLIEKLGVWLNPSGECIELDLRAADVWADEEEDLRLEKGKGLLSDDEHQDALSRSGKAW